MQDHPPFEKPVPQVKFQVVSILMNVEPLEHSQSEELKMMPYMHCGLQVMKCQLLDKILNELMMMVLVRQTEECDMMLHMEKSDMLMLVAKIEVGDKTVDDVDKLAFAADVVKPRQVDLNFAHASI
nr:hypothetical protein [Tanacetum cinerariifolium]